MRRRNWEWGEKYKQWVWPTSTRGMTNDLVIDRSLDLSATYNRLLLVVLAYNSVWIFISLVTSFRHWWVAEWPRRCFGFTTGHLSDISSYDLCLSYCALRMTNVNWCMSSRSSWQQQQQLQSWCCLQTGGFISAMPMGRLMTSAVLTELVILCLGRVCSKLGHVRHFTPYVPYLDSEQTIVL